MRLAERQRPDIQLAKILGWLSGDGHVEERTEKRSGITHRELRFFPDDLEIANAFSSNFRNRFGVTPRIQNTQSSLGCYTVRIAHASTVTFLLSLATFGHFGWRLPRFESEQQSVQWIKCFFDCEAYVNTLFRAVQVKLVNRQGLGQIDQKLNQLGVVARFYGPYRQSDPRWSPYYLLQIKGRVAVRSYSEVIGFNHPLKLAKLKSLLDSRRHLPS